MLSAAEYMQLYKMQNELLKIYMNEPYDELCTQRILSCLDKQLGLNHSLMGFLGNVEERSFAPNVTVKGVDMSFVQKLLTELWMPDTAYDQYSDFWVFSRSADYKKTRLYKSVLKPYHYNDCIIMFLHVPQCQNYIAYMVFFSESKAFSDVEIEMLQLLMDSIAITEDNYVKLWNLKNEARLMVNCTNYFPLGIMLIENLTSVSFVNNLGREYLKELGFPDERFYNAFFVNEIYKRHQYDILNFGASRPIRIKQFLFSVISMSNPGRSLDYIAGDQAANKFLRQNINNNSIRYGEMTTCVYIVCDDELSEKGAISEATLKRMGFTNRERQLVECISRGLSNQEIADKMFISTNTVKIHISNIFRKADVKSRIELLDKLRRMEYSEHN